MKLSNTFAVLCCSLVMMAACKKSTNDDDNKSATQKMLEAGKWQQSAQIASVNHMGVDTTIDLYAELDACEKDDFVLFAGNGTAVKDENTDKCAGSAQTVTILWALLDNDTRLALVDSNPDTFDVAITASQMTLTIIKPNTSGEPVTYMSTYQNIK